MKSTKHQPPGLFNTRVLLVALLFAVLLALLLFWRLGLEVQTGQAGAFVAAVLLAVGLIAEFARRRFRLGLRSMLILVTVLCVLCAIFGNRLIQIRERQQGIDRLRELGVAVTFDYRESGDWVITDSGWPLPEWVGGVFGESTYAQVVEASFWRSSATDDDLAAAAPALRDAIALSFNGSLITGQGLAVLADCQRLEIVELGGLQLDEEGAAHLAKVESLKRLNVSNPSVRDANMAPLAKLANARRIDEIYLPRSGVTDAGMKDLAAARYVKTLLLGRTAITDAGLAELKNMPSLETLNLSVTSITDAGLVHLGEMHDLKSLGLSMTLITDAGLVHLRDLKNLEQLFLPASISDEAAAELQQALPNSKIVR